MSFGLTCQSPYCLVGVGKTGATRGSSCRREGLGQDGERTLGTTGIGSALERGNTRNMSYSYAELWCSRLTTTRDASRGAHHNQPSTKKSLPIQGGAQLPRRCTMTGIVIILKKSVIATCLDLVEKAWTEAELALDFWWRWLLAG